jgi:3-hydroxybutyryl-CoA dehydrogenase
MTIGIIGLGAMGLGIAQVFAQGGHHVRAYDAAEGSRAGAGDRLAAALGPRVAKGAMTAAARDQVLARLQVVDRIADIAPAQLVIEAVVEDLAVKHRVLAEVQGHLAEGAVLATNTSSLSVAAIAGGLVRPQQLLGLHFFNPAPVMRLVELIPHAGTSPAAMAKARALTEGAGKTIIQCADSPGFIVNRCARPYYGEALALLEEGHPAAAIDAAMVAAGYRIGPFALIDLIGADINLAATRGLSAAMGGHPRYHVFTALQAQVDRGDLGRKAGRGFVLDPVPPPADAAAIALRVEAALVNEAAWALAEGIATRDGIDTAMQLGLNFPHGPFAALARLGRPLVRATLAALEAAAPPHLQGRYLPAPDLLI